MVAEQLVSVTRQPLRARRQCSYVTCKRRAVVRADYDTPGADPSWSYLCGLHAVQTMRAHWFPLPW